MKPFAYLAFAAIMVVFDQLSKWAVTEHFTRWWRKAKPFR